MTSVDEDILLDVPAASEYDHSTLLDEDLLLGAGDITNKATNDSIDESALLDSVEPASEQDPEHAPDDDNNVDQDHEEGEVHGGAAESDKEELDYDEEEEDDDRRERTSRYTSEKKGGARVNSDDSEDSKKENSGKHGKPGIPSLFDKTITNNPLKSGDQPIGVVLRIEGEPERVFYPPPAFMASMNAPQIVPRLPNGIPLVGVPSNHGRAGFGIGYQHQARLAGGGGMGGPPQNPGQWENEVAQFMTQMKSRGRVSGKKRRSTSYSSASSYSSDSRSRSRSSSRDRRRDEKRRRRDREHREVRSYKRDDRREDRDRRRHEDRRRDRDSYRDSDRERDSRRRKEESRVSTMESAKALGLSSDYINQMDEQKRKREEIVRKKEERRHGPMDKKENISAVAPLAPALGAPGKDKQKAFLAVNVSGVQQVPTAKIEEMAKKIGPLRKCWRSTDDVVSIIFIAHDKAKEFMIQNNGKVQAGVRLAVTLEKKFLNASEVN